MKSEPANFDTTATSEAGGGGQKGGKGGEGLRSRMCVFFSGSPPPIPQFLRTHSCIGRETSPPYYCIYPTYASY